MLRNQGIFGIPKTRESCVIVKDLAGTGYLINRKYPDVIKYVGSSITLLPYPTGSVNEGTVFLINDDGMYSITASSQFNAATPFAITCNQSDLSVAASSSVPSAEVLAWGVGPSNGYSGTATYTGFLKAGDKIRINSGGVTLGADNYLDQVVISRIA